MSGIVTTIPSTSRLGHEKDLRFRWKRDFLFDPIPFDTVFRKILVESCTKDPTSSDVLYVGALAAPFTVNKTPEATSKALANRKELGSILPADGGDCEDLLSRSADAGVDIDYLAYSTSG